jgi:anhydro-N-acetylmuramic acid kinase
MQKEGSRNKKGSYKVIGAMSGTSLDGLDLAYCLFEQGEQGYTFRIEEAVTIPYPESWQQRLGSLVNASALELQEAHIELGRYMGQEVKKFIDQYSLEPDLLSSHGHTIFHQPAKGFSLQIGDGYQLMLHSDCRVVNDFRSLDVALGGQGAPLVPIGDALLFSEYDFCLNLGGIANVSANKGGKRLAFDICPVNMVLNHLARQQGLAYDEGGRLAASGSPDSILLEMLDSLDFYQQQGPKSLGYEWVAAVVFPLLRNNRLNTANLLHTFCRHVARQIRQSLQPLASSSEKQKMLVTGGGAYNSFLVSLIGEELKPLNIDVIVPDNQLIEFKEALVFAFLGVLRIRQEVNCLASVTGARQNSCGGILYEKI